MRTVLRGGRAVVVGLAMASAVALVDVLYATLGLTGTAHALEEPGVRLALGMASAAILVAIGTRTAWRGFRARTGIEDASDVFVPQRAFATALAATALNPLTIALWTVAFPAAAPDASAWAIVGVALGTMTWYCAFATAVALARSRFGPRALSALDVLTGGALVVFGGLLAHRTFAER